MQASGLPARSASVQCHCSRRPAHSLRRQPHLRGTPCALSFRRGCSLLQPITAAATSDFLADGFAHGHEGTSHGLELQQQQQQTQRREEKSQQQAASRHHQHAAQPLLRQPPWRPEAVHLRTAAYLLLGGLLAWRYAAARLSTAGGTAFASLSSSSSYFHSASQTGVTGAARSAVAGFVAGLLHTLAGADHLAALTPLTIGRSQGRAALLGALWGFGHSTGQLILGLLMVVLKDRFDAFVPALSRWGGTTVGLSLVAIGTFGLLDLWKDHREAAALAAQPRPAMEGVGGSAISSPLSSKDENEDEVGRLNLGLFVNGVLFGLQPDALFVIVPALTLPTQLAAAAYISMFVFGTVAAMGGYTAIIGATSKAIQERNPWLTTNLSALASCIAIAIGALVLVGG